MAKLERRPAEYARRYAVRPIELLSAASDRASAQTISQRLGQSNVMADAEAQSFKSRALTAFEIAAQLRAQHCDIEPIIADCQW